MTDWRDAPCSVGNRSKYYGQVTRGGRRYAAHRLAYEDANGPIPPLMEVCHHCDNPPCIELTHLFLGTHAENVADMIRKGRGQRGHGKLTVSAIAEAVARVERGETQRAVAASLSINQSAISVHVARARRRHATA